MAIAAGELRHRVTLQGWTETRDEYGASIRTWHDVATVWAKVTPVFARERNAAPQVMPVRQFTILIRWRDDVTSDMRLVYRGEQLQIVGIAEVGFREGLQLSVQIVEAG